MMSLLQVTGARGSDRTQLNKVETYIASWSRNGLGMPEAIDAILKVKSNMDSGMFFWVGDCCIVSADRILVWLNGAIIYKTLFI
jgi:hypothetical protein